jgi:hypothetical protein
MHIRRLRNAGLFGILIALGRGSLLLRVFLIWRRSLKNRA